MSATHLDWMKRITSRTYQGMVFHDSAMCTQVRLQFRNRDVLCITLCNHRKFLGDLFYDDWRHELRSLTVSIGYLTADTFQPTAESYEYP